MVDWLDPKAPSLARIFKKAGYATAHFGKWHMGGGRDVGDAPQPKAYGFDEHETDHQGLGPRTLRTDSEGVVRALDARSMAHGGSIHEVSGTDVSRWQVTRTIDFIRRHQEQPFYIHLWFE